MKNKMQITKIVYYIFFIFCLVLTGLFIWKKNYYIALTQASFALIGMVYIFLKITSLKKYIYNSLNKFLESFSGGKQSIINSFKLPIIIVTETGEIIWYNTVFRSDVLLNNDVFGDNINVVIKDLEGKTLFDETKVVARYNNKIYDVYISISKNKSKVDRDKNTYIMFFIDTTKCSMLEKQIDVNRPVVALINIDNYEDIVSNSSTSEKNRIINSVEMIVNNYFGVGSNGVVRKVEKDLFIVVQESKYISQMIDDKFSILDKVRGVSDDIKVQVTLSVGIGFDSKSINESEQFAKQSLDMALGRGGDQVVLKRNDSYEFFGGLSSGKVKSTKVKTRIVATSLVELIEESENVVIMGHRFADLDCLGAAIGMVEGVKLVDDQKEAYIVIDREKNLANSLINRVKAKYNEEVFISPDDAGDYINKKTLLIIVDTHIKSFLESIEVYQSCKQVVVIDHHRKMVDHISDAVIFYHEPSASSTCEMVTELLQYFSNKKMISSVEADALLSGIMLDTRNFVLKTGVRTFEAAAYLKKRGADTIAVKKLFSNNIESYQKKTRLVSSAEIYKKCAISVAEDAVEDLKIIAAQAADEMLTISDVDASFVIYNYSGCINISARSMGLINVQVIMEWLGGGGHLVMAGVQLNGITIEEAKARLFQAIDKYDENIK